MEIKNAPSEKRGVIFAGHNQIMILVTVVTDLKVDESKILPTVDPGSIISVLPGGPGFDGRFEAVSGNQKA